MTFKVIIEVFPSDAIWKSLLFPYSKKIFVITYFSADPETYAPYSSVQETQKEPYRAKKRALIVYARPAPKRPKKRTVPCNFHIYGVIDHYRSMKDGDYR